ncbi:MAG: hypothetical protein KKH41_03595 [Candidatus Thermoplasmatota archaeon]|nr:hypothetical protein [Candidatus Thermoplasmatota archaeon]
MKEMGDFVKKKKTLIILLIFLAIVLSVISWGCYTYWSLFIKYPYDFEVEVNSMTNENISLGIHFFTNSTARSGAHGNLTIQIEDENGAILWRNRTVIEDYWSYGYQINWTDMNPEPIPQQNIIIRAWFDVAYVNNNDMLYAYTHTARL